MRNHRCDALSVRLVFIHCLTEESPSDLADFLSQAPLGIIEIRRLCIVSARFVISISLSQLSGSVIGIEVFIVSSDDFPGRGLGRIPRTVAQLFDYSSLSIVSGDGS